MRKPRFVVEGEWTGYTSSQRRVCHVSVHTHGREGFEKLRSIRFTDGTSLILRVRDALKGEKVQERRQYCQLINDCIRKGVSSVAELTTKESA